MVRDGNEEDSEVFCFSFKCSLYKLGKKYGKVL